MIRLTLLALAVMLAAPTAHARDNFPSAVNNAITKGRDFCTQMGGTDFAFDTNKIIRGDFSGDGHDDYIINSGDFNCTGAASIYGGSAGNEITVLISQRSGNVYKVENMFGYEATFKLDHKPPVVAVAGRCDSDPMQTGHAYWILDARSGRLQLHAEHQGCPATPR